MCGIIGILAKKDENIVPVLLNGLERLEYRGYDSAGVAVYNGKEVVRCRTVGKTVNLRKKITDTLAGSVGIGHIRWATHGAPSESNAHPHADGVVTLVHNGIIENYRELKEKLTADGVSFESETDTEVAVHLISKYLKANPADPLLAVRTATKELKGSYAFLIMLKDYHDMIIGVRKDSPLAVTETDKGIYFGSDAIALALFADRITYLEDGDIAIADKKDGIKIYDAENNRVFRAVDKIALISDDLSQGEFSSYMIKEMSEQPVTVAKTLATIFDDTNKRIKLPDLGIDYQNLENITIVACGTSYHAGLMAKYWIEEFFPMFVDVDIASEYRYRRPCFKKGGLAVFLSQSGETADTLAALRFCKNNGQKILSIVNVVQSTIARESDAVLYTQAGAEICVASTKSLTAQMVLLLGLVIGIARVKGKIDAGKEDFLLKQMFSVPALIEEVLNKKEQIGEIAERYLRNAPKVIYIGRGLAFPVSLEGALKMKELAYIPCEGYAAGEMKHGPIALIDKDTPVVVIAPSNNLSDKTASNMQEAAARGGKIILITDGKGKQSYQKFAAEVIEIPETLPILEPFPAIVAEQFLAYYTATAMKLDVDKPRNLAKSVTVE